MRYLAKGDSVLVSAPTGTGKTLVADFLVEEVLARGGRVVYTAPIKALSNQKFREYRRKHGDDAVGLVTGDAVINRDAPLQIMTTEILRNILLQGVGPRGEAHTIENIDAVVFDELHFLDDLERGTVWEEVLIYLEDSVQILGLSATLSNLDELLGWLRSIRTEHVVHSVKYFKRAVPLEFFIANTEGIYEAKSFPKTHAKWLKDRDRQSRKGGANRRNKRRRSKDRDRNNQSDDKATTHLQVVRQLQPSAYPALYFMFSRKGTERAARGLAKRMRRGLLSRQETKEVYAILDAFEDDNPDILQPFHRQLYNNGVAFHHAGLNVRLKDLVETLYEKKLVKVLYCTSTFALGINMPARTVIFDGLSKFNGKEIAPLTVRQFMQKAGRAGRRGMDVAGDVLIKLDFDQYPNHHEHLKKLFAGQSEPVISAFNLSFNSVVNLTKRYEDDEIRALLNRSFFAYQENQRRARIANELEQHESRAGGMPVEEQGHAAKREMKRLRKLRRRLERRDGWLWRLFQEKVHFLQELGYLSASKELGAGAKILRHIQIEEVFITELVLEGVFDHLDAEDVFALCVGLVHELPRNVRVQGKPSRTIRNVLGTVRRVFHSDVITEAQRLAGGEPSLDGDMTIVGRLWVDGASLADIMDRVNALTDVSGDIVGALRRAKDLVGQLRHVYWDDKERRQEFKRVMKAITRDEVEAF